MFEANLIQLSLISIRLMILNTVVAVIHICKYIAGYRSVRCGSDSKILSNSMNERYRHIVRKNCFQAALYQKFIRALFIIVVKILS